jgi:hypothetical protein
VVPDSPAGQARLAAAFDRHPRTDDEEIECMKNQAQGKSGRRSLLLIGVVVLALGLITSAFLWFGGSGKRSHAYALAPESALPDKVRQAPGSVQDAYRFAIANRDLLRQIPCYCGCGAEHRSNAECYIKDVRPDGSTIFDFMSLG